MAKKNLPTIANEIDRLLKKEVSQRTIAEKARGTLSEFFKAYDRQLSPDSPVIREGVSAVVKEVTGRKCQVTLYSASSYEMVRRLAIRLPFTAVASDAFLWKRITERNSEVLQHPSPCSLNVSQRAALSRDLVSAAVMISMCRFGQNDIFVRLNAMHLASASLRLLVNAALAGDEEKTSLGAKALRLCRHAIVLAPMPIEKIDVGVIDANEDLPLYAVLIE